MDVTVRVGGDAGSWSERIPESVCADHRDGGSPWTREAPEVSLSPQGCGNVVVVATAPGYQDATVDAGWLSCESEWSTLFTTVSLDPS